MKRGPDAAMQLARALAERCPGGRVAAHDSTRWASATFTGARHTLRLECPPSAALESWLAALPDADLPLRGHLVADLTVACVRRDDRQVTATIEALTVAES